MWQPSGRGGKFTLPRTRLFDRLCTTAARTLSPTAAGCTSTRATGTGTLRSSSGAYSERRRLESRQKPSNTVGLLLRANKVNKSEIWSCQQMSPYAKKVWCQVYFKSNYPIMEINLFKKWRFGKGFLNSLKRVGYGIYDSLIRFFICWVHLIPCSFLIVSLEPRS